MIWDLRVSLNLPECEVRILMCYIVRWNILVLGIINGKETNLKKQASNYGPIHLPTRNLISSSRQLIFLSGELRRWGNGKGKKLGLRRFMPRTLIFQLL